MEATPAMSALCMQALVERLAVDSGGVCRLRSADNSLVAEVPLAVPAGEVIDGELQLAESLEGVAVLALTPVMAEFADADGVVLIRARCRLGGAPDDGEPVVVGDPTATSVVAGVFVQIASGTISLLPAP